MTKQLSPRKWKFDDITVGYRAELSPRNFSEQEIQQFPELAGDWNPLHLSRTFAKLKNYTKCTVHGILLTTQFSYLVGMIIPGEDCLYLAQDICFRKPIFVGERFQVVGTVMSKSEATRTLEIKTEIFNSKKELAVNGVARVKMI